MLSQAIADVQSSFARFWHGFGGELSILEDQSVVRNVFELVDTMFHTTARTRGKRSRLHAVCSHWQKEFAGGGTPQRRRRRKRSYMDTTTAAGTRAYLLACESSGEPAHELILAALSHPRIALANLALVRALTAHAHPHTALTRARMRRPMLAQTAWAWASAQWGTV